MSLLYICFQYLETCWGEKQATHPCLPISLIKIKKNWTVKSKFGRGPYISLLSHNNDVHEGEKKVLLSYNKIPMSAVNEVFQKCLLCPNCTNVNEELIELL